MNLNLYERSEIKETIDKAINDNKIYCSESERYLWLRMTERISNIMKKDPLNFLIALEILEETTNSYFVQETTSHLASTKELMFRKHIYIMDDNG